VIAVTVVVMFVLIVFFVVVVAVMVVVVNIRIKHANKELASIPDTETVCTRVRRTNHLRHLLESKVRIWTWVEVIRHRRWVEGECRLLGREVEAFVWSWTLNEEDEMKGVGVVVARVEVGNSLSRAQLLSVPKVIRFIGSYADVVSIRGSEMRKEKIKKLTTRLHGAFVPARMKW
jgi:hypothetical protein